MTAKTPLVRSMLIVLIPLCLVLVTAQRVTTAGEDTEYFRIRGKLESLDVKNKKAVISGRTWEVVKDFSTKDVRGDHSFLSDRTASGGTVMINFYVVLQTVPGGSASTLPPADQSLVRTNIGRDDVSRIHEMGGKIYAIELPSGS